MFLNLCLLQFQSFSMKIHCDQYFCIIQYMCKIKYTIKYTGHIILLTQFSVLVHWQNIGLKVNVRIYVAHSVTTTVHNVVVVTPRFSSIDNNLFILVKVCVKQKQAEGVLHWEGITLTISSIYKDSYSISLGFGWIRTFKSSICSICEVGVISQTTKLMESLTPLFIYYTYYFSTIFCNFR